MNARLVLLALVLAAPAPSIRGSDWSDGQAADLVIGQSAFDTNLSGTAADRLDEPQGVAVDPTTGSVFVSDKNNRRVLRFVSLDSFVDGDPAVGVLGQADLVSNAASNPPTASSIGVPAGLAVGADGTLWVADVLNHRILRFANAATAADADGAPADGVLGQPGLTTNDLATTQGGMNSPNDVAVSPGGTLYVLDSGNNRVLRFDNAALLADTDGAPATEVLGQPDFTTGNSAGVTATGFFNPTGLALDSAGRLWVVDRQNSRVLRLDNAANRGRMDPANGVLGQGVFTTSSFGTDAASFRFPSKAAAGPDGTLWVADTINHRVLRFDDAAGKENGAPADGVLGQPDFVSSGAGLSASKFNIPVGLTAPDAATLLVADNNNHRVLRFRIFPLQPDNRIGPSRNRQRGDDLWNRNGVGQTLPLSRRGGRRAAFFFSVQNDGALADSIRVRATPGNRAVSSRVARIGGGNVTSALRRGLLLPGLEPQEAATFRATLLRHPRIPRARRTFSIRSTSVGAPAQLDVVKARASFR